MKARTPEQIEAARERLRAHDQAEAELLASRGGNFGTLDALELCNACDIDQMHDGCNAGYCTGCCPAHRPVSA